MSKFLTQVEGFTPVIDVVVDDIGLVPAIVYGIVWRYCQMDNGICRASLDTIADKIGMSRKTVERHIKALCEAGYLEDTTPEVRNRPHIYTDTGKTKIEGLLHAKTESRSTESESLTAETESPSTQTESLTTKTESRSGSDRESDRGKTESLMKIPYEDTLEDRIEDTLLVDAGASTSKGQKRKGTSPPKKTTLSPNTPEHERLFSRLRANAKAKGRRGPSRFPSLECMQKFDTAAEVLNGELDKALTKALEQGAVSVVGATNYVAKWASNVRERNGPIIVKQ